MRRLTEGRREAEESPRRFTDSIDSLRTPADSTSFPLVLDVDSLPEFEDFVSPLPSLSLSCSCLV